MLRKLYLGVLALVGSAFMAVAQNQGAIKVTLTDQKTKEPLAFANVIVTAGGVQAGVGTTDFDGNVTIKPLAPGKYDVKAVYVGYQPKAQTGVLVSPDKTTYVTFALSNEEGVKLDEVVVTEYSVPLIDKDTKSGATIGREQYQNMATKNISSVASTAAGIVQRDEGKGLNVRGGRSGNTNVFIDGERAIGSNNLPQSAIDQIGVILGGVPAQYGDVTSGVISVTTRGSSPKFFGSVEAITSQLTDRYGYNFLGFSVGGPIWSKKDSAGNKKPVIGFMLAGEFVSEKDPDPSAVGIYKVKDDKLKELEKKPYIKVTTGEVVTFRRAAEFLTNADLEKVKARQNVGSRQIRLNPKIDFNVTDKIKITVGGSWDYDKRHEFIYDYALMNSANNPQAISNTMRGYVRFTQKFSNASASEQEKAQSLIKNAYFTFQAGYQNYRFKRQDDNHKQNFFDYGHIGKFEQLKGKYTLPAGGFYANINGTPTYVEDAYVQAFNYDSLLRYTPSDKNPLTSNYTTQVYDEMGASNITSIFALSQMQGLINGSRPGNVHSLWLNTGRSYPQFYKQDNRIFRITSNFSADIKNHNIIVGIEYDQRDERAFVLNANDLWTRMRQLANLHNQDLDTANPIITTNYTSPYFPILGADTLLSYNPLYQASAQSSFSKYFYEAVGKSPNSTDFIDVDNMDPGFYKLEWLTPDEMLRQGSGAIVDAYGFDYYGNRLKEKVSFTDFIGKYDKNKFGDTVYNRLVGAFRPTYMAGYIEDKFDFKDIKFRVGVRVDRFDANQYVLKDRYLLHEAYKIKDKSGAISAFGQSVPGNVNENAVVYVDDFNNPTRVVGYRNGDTWYDANGNEVSDPKLIADQTGGIIQPWVVNPSDAKKNPYSNSAFEKYKPQINVMPRVAFTFPISDVARFSAHYDILTQRPTAGNRLDPKDYYFLAANQGGVVANPNLKPERTVDYEIGFDQVLNDKKNAAIKINAFYREMRNMIQIQRVNQAYPLSYLTYGNIDFGTVKGLSAEFETRRMNSGVEFRINYTLQFAEGSGSNANGGYSLASTSQPNLRVTLPLDFDQRHTFVGTIDYYFGEGKDYKGPSTIKRSGDTEKKVEWLKKVGINFTTRVGSGTPYTKIQQPVSSVLSGVAANTTVDGSLNGSYYPWQFRTDVRIQKVIDLEFGKKQGDDKAKQANLTVYLQVLNLFNTKNVLRVHPYTGSPTDDGYLSAPLSQTQLASIQALGSDYYASFIDLYRAKLNDPTFYSIPRRIRIGLILGF